MSHFLDSNGDLWIEPIAVIAFHATTTVFWIGSAHGAVRSQPDLDLRGVEGTGGEFNGGSGRNWRVTSGPTGVQRGFYTPSAPNIWKSIRNPDWTWTRDPGDGTFALHDGTDVLATTAASGLASGVASAGTLPAQDYSYDAFLDLWIGLGDPDILIYFETASGKITDSSGFPVATRAGVGSTASDPAGVYVSTVYGADTFNGGAPFTYTVTVAGSASSAGSTAYGQATYGGAPFAVAVEFEGGAEFSTRRASFRAGDSSAQAGFYTPIGWQSWESADNPLWTATIDGDGAGVWSDGTDVVATRAADATRLYDLTGDWFPTAYGLSTYGPAIDTTAGTASAGSFPGDDWELAATAGDIETWVAKANPALYVDLDTTTGNAFLMTGTETVGERLGGSTASPDGVYTATAYGADTYHAGDAWTYTLATTTAGGAFSAEAGHDRAQPLAGIWWAELTLDGSNEVTAVSEVKFGAAVPANSSVLAVIPIAESDGSGTILPIVTGSLPWRP